ncbi:MAG: hypothetical protein PSN34_11510 [Urechidicola sp.]|nr:hypothetical protein [Urechidicola sp.]
MSLIKLNPKEIEVIKASIELRRKSVENNLDQISKLDDIVERLNSYVIDLKPLQRAKLIGCIREYLIYPNEDLFKLSDYEVFCSVEEVKDRMRKVDIGLSAMNKLKKKKDKKFRIFEDTIEKVNQLASKKKVYFSETENGKVYKIGIVGANGKGIKIEADGSPIENFKLEKVHKDWFMKSSSPKEIIAKIENYGQRNRLTENQIRAKEILKKEACV